MIIIIILITIILASIYMINKDIYVITDQELNGLAYLIVIFASFLLIFQTVAYTIKPYRYNKFVAKKNTIEQTVKDVRKNGNEYETSAIMKEVIWVNTTIAENQFKNKNLFFGQYVDDRFENLKPIE